MSRHGYHERRMMEGGLAVEAVLFDLYDTLARPDWAVLDAGRRELAERVGVAPDRLRAEWRRTGELRARGALGPPEVELGGVLRACGVDLPVETLRELAAVEGETWRRGVRLYDDVLLGLGRLRAREARLVLVSNCSWQAGAVAGPLGLAEAMDAVVLSFEVGVAKPDPAILLLALDRVGVVPGRAALVDDVALNLDAARTLGFGRTVQIVRPGVSVEPAREARHPRAGMMAEVEALLEGAPA